MKGMHADGWMKIPVGRWAQPWWLRITDGSWQGLPWPGVGQLIDGRCNGGEV